MKRVSAPGYDLFKTIVTVVLAIILLLMLLRGCATDATTPAATEVIAAPNATETHASMPVATDTISIGDAIQTLTPTPEPPANEPTVTPAAADDPTATTTAAEPEAPTATPEQAAPTQEQNVSCNTVVPSRLNVGQTAQVVRRLNMRNDAFIDAAIIQTNPINAQVEIIGGPVCTPVGERAYLWWQIRLANGVEGWSAESPLNEASYFLEPTP